MARDRWHYAKSFCHGLMAALAAQTVGWLASVSLAGVWQFIGHVAGAMALSILQLGS